jgi:hypothetical protein
MVEGERKKAPATFAAEVSPEPLPWVRDEEPALA